MEPKVALELTGAEVNALGALLNLAANISGPDGAKMAGRLILKCEQAVATFNAKQQSRTQEEPDA